MQPMDYTTNTPNPLQTFQSAFATGDMIRRQQEAARLAEAQKLQAEAEAKRKEQLMSMYEALRLPGATVKQYENLANMLPKEQAESLMGAYKMRNEAELQADLVDTIDVFGPLNAGLTDVAVRNLRKQADAERAAGNEDAAVSLEDYIQKIEESPDGAKAIENMLGLTILKAPKGKDALEAVIKFNEDKRKAIEHPILIEQKNAELDKAKSEAEKSAIEAKYAEKDKIAELEDAAAGLGLTKAQTNETIARTKKLDMEIAKALMELKAFEKTGGVDPEKRFEQEVKIRGEYQKRIANYNELTQTYDRIKASSGDTSGAGDVALVTGFMKMLDPGSVVRESEFANARDTVGLYGTLESVLTKVKNGQFLTPKQRKDFTDLAGKYMEASKGYEDKVRKDLGVVVKNYGLSSENVFGTIDQTGTTRQVPQETRSNKYGREQTKRTVEVDY